MFTNAMFARGTIVNFKLNEVKCNMRAMVRDNKNQKYERVNETVEVLISRGVITLRINDEDMKFKINVTKQKNYFTAGERLAPFYGYDKWWEMYEHFKEDPTPENNYVELLGYLSDGSFYDTMRDRMVNCMSWEADTIRWASTRGDVCKGKFCGMFCKDDDRTVLFAAPHVGNTCFRMYSRIMDCITIPEDVKKAVKKDGFSPACDIVISRKQTTEFDDLGMGTVRSGISIEKIAVSEKTGAWGWITRESVEASIQSRAAFETKRKQEAMWNM